VLKLCPPVSYKKPVCNPSIAFLKAMGSGLQVAWVSFFWLFACVFGMRQRLPTAAIWADTVLGDTVQKSKEAVTVDTVLVDTVEKCQDAVANLLQEQNVAIDIEGINLGRDGEVCWIQMTGASSPAVYLFDIYALKENAFGEGRLRELLESEQVTKVFYDVRGDNDALYHLHGVEVHAAYDIQIMWHVRFQNSGDIYLQGLKHVLNAFLQKTQILSRAQLEAMADLKKQGPKSFVPEHEASYEAWKQRPMLPVLLQYAAVDVKYLLDMKELCTPKDNDLAQQLDSVVKEMSATRLQGFVELPDEQALEHSTKKYRDFEIPEGFNDSGDVSQMVYVPSHVKGLLIGKGGATIKALHASTGARVSVIGNSALVVGQPEQVYFAVQQIYHQIGFGYTVSVA